MDLAHISICFTFFCCLFYIFLKLFYQVISALELLCLLMDWPFIINKCHSFYVIFLWNRAWGEGSCESDLLSAFWRNLRGKEKQDCRGETSKGLGSAGVESQPDSTGTLKKKEFPNLSDLGSFDFISPNLSIIGCIC